MSNKPESSSTNKANSELKQPKKVKTTTKHFRWKIKDYVQWAKAIPNGSSKLSPLLKIHATNSPEPFVFQLKLYPNGDSEEIKEYVSLYLENNGEKEANVECFFYLQYNNILFQGLKFGPRSIPEKEDFGFQRAFTKPFIRNNDKHPKIFKKYLRNRALVLGCFISLNEPLEEQFPHFSQAIGAKKSLSQRFEEHFSRSKPENFENFEQFSDFEIICDSEQPPKIYKCHKLLLSMGSPVFKAMLEHDVKENRENKVIITDINSETIDKLLNFIYTGNVSSNMIDLSLLAAANKYQVERLQAVCENHLVHQMGVDNVSQMAITANMHGTTAFKEETIKYLACHWTDINKSNKLEDINRHPDLLMKIINNLAVEKTKSNVT